MVDINPSINTSKLTPPRNVAAGEIDKARNISNSDHNISTQHISSDSFSTARKVGEFVIGELFNNVPKNVNVFAASSQYQTAGTRIYTPDIHSYALNSQSPTQALIDASTLAQGEKITTFNGKIYRLSNNPERSGYVDEHTTADSSLHKNVGQTPVISVVSNNSANSKKIDVALIIIGKNDPFYYSKDFDDSLKEDAEMMKAIAKDFGLKPNTKIVVLETPTKEELKNAFNEIAEYQKLNNSSKALVGFTGHGNFEEESSVVSTLIKGAEGTRKGKLLLGYEYTDKNTGEKISINDKGSPKKPNSSPQLSSLLNDKEEKVPLTPPGFYLNNLSHIEDQKTKIVRDEDRKVERLPPSELAHPGPPKIDEKYNAKELYWNENEIYEDLSTLSKFESVDFVIDACHSGALSRPDFSKVSVVENAFKLVKDFFSK